MINLRRGYIRMFVVAAFGIACVGCSHNCPPVVRPKVGPPPPPKQQPPIHNMSQVLASLAPGAASDADPAVCLAQGASDPKENPLGGRTSIAPYTFSAPPHIQDMYATLYIDTEICTKQTLSSSDESRIQKVMGMLGISQAQSFASNLSLKGDALGGVTYPQLVPFSYSFDTKTNKYTISTTSVGVIPWQPTTAFEIGWQYGTSSTVSIGTAALFSKIVTAVSGAGGTSSLLSPAASAYLNAGDAVAQDVASALSNTNSEHNDHHFDLKQGPDSPARSVTFRFRDAKNQPLAGVRLAVAFTNSLLTQDAIDPTTDDATHVPKFTDGSAVPPIVNVTVAGPSSGSQTLLQQISKDTNYQNLLKSTADTTKESFRTDCTNFENDLQTLYGLNKYDQALTMGYVLSQNTPYLTYDKFYSGGCFVVGRGLLDTMGIRVFDQKPSN